MSDGSSIAAGRSQTTPLPTWLQAALLPLVTLLVYIPAMQAGFVWDDDTTLLENIVFEKNGLYRAWLTTEFVSYWPITWTSYWLEHELWGFRPTGYHVVNVLVHATSSLLLWRVLLRLNIPGAWFVALVFAVHPVNVASVAWITQRKNVLSMLFYLTTLLCYLRFGSTKNARWYWMAVVAFGFSMLSKGSSATLPVVLLLMAWWQRGCISRRDVLRSVPFFLVTALMSATEIWFQANRAIREDIIRDAGFFERLAASGWIVWFYLHKALLPINLAFVYPLWKVDPYNWLSYVPGVMLVVMLGVCWRSRNEWGRPPLFALSYFVVTLAPILGFVDIYYMRYSLVADQYQYLSIIGVLTLAVGGLMRTANRLAADNRLPITCAAALIVVLLGTLSWQQAATYKDEETLWADTLRKNPQSMLALVSRGVVYSKQGRREIALQYYFRAMELHPHVPLIPFKIAEEFRTQNRFDEALRYYRQALSQAPGYWEVHSGLATLLAELDRLDEAIEHMQQAVAARPENSMLHYNHANFLRERGRLDESVIAYQHALELEPDKVAVLNNLARVLISLGRVKAAIGHLKKAVSIEPNNAMLHRNLRFALEQGAADGRSE